jgi:tetratricopeptide (TPR) repeat protein
MPRDVFGLPVTTATPAALERYGRGVVELLSWGRDALGHFRAAAEHDPALALAHAGQAVVLFLDEQFKDARTAAEAARATAGAATGRERSHVEALALLVTGKTDAAEAAMREHLAAHPRDLVVFQRLYFVLFWRGAFPEMLALTESLLPAHREAPFVLGLHAFALEEDGRCDDARRLAESALERDPQDAWAVHALAHALYESGASEQGLAALPPAIHPCTHLGWFRSHLLWHLALMHLSVGHYARARTLSRRVFERAPSAVAGELHDSISLLWRRDLHDEPAGDAWRPFAAIAAGRLGRQGLPFHAVHLAMALAGAGDWDTAQRQLGMLRERAGKDHSGLVAELVIPLIEGLHAFAARDHGRAIERILPLRSRIVALGGSRAQRDVFHDTLLEACFRAGRLELAERLLAERLGRRPDHYWTRRRLGLSRPDR